jgi:hypothetical protein
MLDSTLPEHFKCHQKVQYPPRKSMWVAHEFTSDCPFKILYRNFVSFCRSFQRRFENPVRIALATKQPATTLIQTAVYIGYRSYWFPKNEALVHPARYAEFLKPLVNDASLRGLQMFNKSSLQSQVHTTDLHEPRARCRANGFSSRAKNDGGKRGRDAAQATMQLIAPA